MTSTFMSKFSGGKYENNKIYFEYLHCLFPDQSSEFYTY
jgi:hypothetical protein